MAVRRRGGAWQADVFIDGKRTRRDFPTETEAREWAEAHTKRKVQWTAPSAESCDHEVPEPGVVTFGVAADRTYERYWRGGKHERKQEQLKDRVVADVGRNTPIRDLDTSFMDDYIMRLRRQGKSASTVNHRLSIVSKTVRYAVERMGVDARLPRIEREKVFNERMRFMTDAEEKTVLSLCARWGKDEHREVIVTLLDTGMRPSEMQALEERDVSLFSRPDGKLSATIRINKSLGEGRIAGATKGQTVRTIYATERVAIILRRRKEAAESAATRLFPRDNQWLRQVWDRIKSVMGLDADPNFVPYICRHTCASRMVQRGVALPVIQKWMGHKQIQMTMRYANVADHNLEAAMGVLNGDGPVAPSESFFANMHGLTGQ